MIWTLIRQDRLTFYACADRARPLHLGATYISAIYSVGADPSEVFKEEHAMHQISLPNRRRRVDILILALCLAISTGRIRARADEALKNPASTPPSESASTEALTESKGTSEAPLPTQSVLSVGQTKRAESTAVVKAAPLPERQTEPQSETAPATEAHTEAETANPKRSPRINQPQSRLSRKHLDPPSTIRRRFPSMPSVRSASTV